MRKWEYLYLDQRFHRPVGGPKAGFYSYALNGVESKQDNLFVLLAELGDEGWELITADVSESPVTFIFKRPKS